MSTKYLGSTFDIHGGGLDLRFPHHENELAQSRAAGDEFANFWLHNGLVNVGGQKMSKSLGNSVFAVDLFNQARPIAARYFLGSAHYRSVLDLHDSALAEAEAAVSRIEGFVARAQRKLGVVQFIAAHDRYQQLPAAFVSAMDEDLNLPAALGALHEAVRAGNAALDAGEEAAAQVELSAVVAMLDVLGLNPGASVWSAAGNDSAEAQALESLMQSLIAERNAARANKDFARSDAIRDQLKAAGIQLEDAADATNWSIN
jgi:cysteinyl-tRNA synthetase